MQLERTGLYETRRGSETLEENLTAALGLASKFGQAYRRAGFAERRTFNRAVVESIEIDVGGRVTKVALAQPFRTLLTTV